MRLRLRAWTTGGRPAAHARVSVLAVAAFRGVLSSPTKVVRDALVNQCAQILACYRKNCASPSSAGQVLQSPLPLGRSAWPVCRNPLNVPPS